MTDGPIQLIFCVESTKKAATDSKYINEVLKQYFMVGENKISYVYMNGKYNYNHLDTRKKIAKHVKDYQITGGGKSYIIYVFDKDLNTVDHRDSTFELDVKKYCKDQKYSLIWFVKTVEDVMWGKKIHAKEKKRKAIQFIGRQQIKEVKKVNLSARANVNAAHKSNILTVLGKFLQLLDAS